MHALLAAVLLLSPNLTSIARIASASEPGTRMVITGVVLRADGRTPAPGVVLMLYHTNAKGIYPRRDGDPREGYLRGWLRTDARGRYRIESIRPAPYPGGKGPAHIHVVVKTDGKPDQWIDEIVFADDPNLAEAKRRGGTFNVVALTKQNGVWMGTRNLLLPK